jgi:hypothetical protein
MIFSERTIHPSFPRGEKYACLLAGNEFPVQRLGLGIYSSGNLSLSQWDMEEMLTINKLSSHNKKNSLSEIQFVCQYLTPDL